MSTRIDDIICEKPIETLENPIRENENENREEALQFAR